MAPDDLVAVGKGQQDSRQILPMPFQGLALHSGSFHQLIHRQFARVFHPLQQFRSDLGEIQRPAASDPYLKLLGMIHRVGDDIQQFILMTVFRDGVDEFHGF